MINFIIWLSISACVFSFLWLLVAVFKAYFPDFIDWIDKK